MSNVFTRSREKKRLTAESGPPVSAEIEVKTREKLLPWSSFTALFLLVVTFFIAFVSGSLYTSIYAFNVHHWTLAQESQWLNNSVAGQFGYSVVVYAIWLLLFILFIPFYGLLIGKGIKYGRKWRSIFRTIGWVKPKWRDIIYALAGFGVYFFVFIIASTIIGKIFPGFNPTQQQNVGFQGGAQGSGLVLAFISLVVLPPIVEETAFRGFLFTGLKKSFPIFWATLITSVLFAAPHLFEGVGGKLLLVGGLDTFILSFVLVYLRQQTGSLWSSVGLHMLKNGVAFGSLFLFAHVLL
jgi:membrane protease YdiL (CAAX protease family)